MRSKVIDGVLVYKPTREDVESLRVGDMVPDCFGKLARVVEIHAQRDDIHGKAFCCFYTEFGPTSRISGSIKEDEIVASIPVIDKFKRCDSIQW